MNYWSPFSWLDSKVSDTLSLLHTPIEMFTGAVLAIATVFFTIWMMWRGLSIMAGQSTDSFSETMKEGLFKIAICLIATGAMAKTTLITKVPDLAESMAKDFAGSGDASPWATLDASIVQQVLGLAKVFVPIDSSFFQDALDNRPEGPVGDAMLQELGERGKAEQICAKQAPAAMKEHIKNFENGVKNGVYTAGELNSFLQPHLHTFMKQEMAKAGYSKVDHKVALEYTAQCLDYAYRESKSDSSLWGFLKEPATAYVAYKTARNNGMSFITSSVLATAAYKYADLIDYIPFIVGKAIMILALVIFGIPIFIILTMNKIFLTLCLVFAPLMIASKAFSPINGWFGAWLNATITYVFAYSTTFLVLASILSLLKDADQVVGRITHPWYVLAASIAFFIVAQILKTLVFKTSDLVGQLFGGKSIADEAGRKGVEGAAGAAKQVGGAGLMAGKQAGKAVGAMNPFNGGVGKGRSGLGRAWDALNRKAERGIGKLGKGAKNQLGKAGNAMANKLKGIGGRFTGNTAKAMANQVGKGVASQAGKAMMSQTGRAVGAQVAGRALTSAGVSTAAQIGGRALAVANPIAGVAMTGAAAYQVGSMAEQWLDENGGEGYQNAKQSSGRMLARVAAFFGNESAKEALAMEERANKVKN